MTKIINRTQWYKIVYEPLMGVLKFIRVRDDAHTYWSTGHIAREMLDKARNMSPKELNEMAQQFEYHPPEKKGSDK